MDASAVKSTATNERSTSLTTKNGPLPVGKKTRHRKKKKRHGAAAAVAEATGSSSLDKVLAETASGPFHSVNGSKSTAPRSFSPCSGSSIEKFSSEDEEGKTDEDEDGEEDEYSSESEDEGESGYKPGGYHRVEVGEVYNSRFQVLEKLGWGHFSTVWKCVDRQTGATVALKVQKSARHYTDAARDEIELLEGTVRAAEATQSESTIEQQEVIKVVRLIDSFEHKGPNGLHVCMVFEMMGDNLLTLIKYYNYRGVPLQLVQRLTRDMMEGLAFLHGKCEIIHTDLKPENVLLTHHIPQLPKIRKSQWDEFRATRLARHGKSADMFRNEDKSTGKVSNRTVSSGASAEVSKEEKKRLKNRLKKKRQKQRKQCGKNERGASTDGDTAGNKMGSTARPSLPPSDASVDSLRNGLSQLAFSASIDNTSPTNETFKSNFAGHAVDYTSESTNVTRVWYRQVGQLGDEEERDWVHMPPEFAARAMLLLPEGRVAGSKRKEREFTITVAAESTQSLNECASNHGKDDEVVETSFVLRYLDHVDSDVIKSIQGQVLGLCGRSVSLKSVSTTEVTYRVWRLEFDARYTHAVLYHLERRIEGLRFLNVAPSSGLALPGFFLPKPLGDQDIKRAVEAEDTGHCDSAADVNIQGINLAPLAGSLEKVLEIVPLRQRLGRWALRLNNIAHGELFDVMKLDAKICDLGNACWTTKHFTDDIQTRQYRCPEVILGKRYDTSADIWSMACFVFELLTGDLLFDPKNGRSFNRDEDHLAQMMELLGRMPKSFTGSRQGSRDFFNRKGDLKRIRNLKYWSLQQVLIEKYHFSRVDAECLASFLSPMLRYEPSKRATASECLAHPWLAHVDDVLGKKE